MNSHARATAAWPTPWLQPRQMHGADVKDRQLEARAHKGGAVGGHGELFSRWSAGRRCDEAYVAAAAANAGLDRAKLAETHARVAQIKEAITMEREACAARHWRTEWRDRRDHHLGTWLAVECEIGPLGRLSLAVAVEDELERRRLPPVHDHPRRLAA